MCDIYLANCKKCNKEIEMHIADFAYPECDVEVFCEEHLPENKITIFYLPQNKKWGVRLCRGKIEPNSVGVHPNERYYSTKTKLIYNSIDKK